MTTDTQTTPLKMEVGDVFQVPLEMLRQVGPGWIALIILLVIAAVIFKAMTTPTSQRRYTNPRARRAPNRRSRREAW